MGGGAHQTMSGLASTHPPFVTRERPLPRALVGWVTRTLSLKHGVSKNGHLGLLAHEHLKGLPFETVVQDIWGNGSRAPCTHWKGQNGPWVLRQPCGNPWPISTRPLGNGLLAHWS